MNRRIETIEDYRSVAENLADYLNFSVTDVRIKTMGLHEATWIVRPSVKEVSETVLPLFRKIHQESQRSGSKLAKIQPSLEWEVENLTRYTRGENPKAPEVSQEFLDAIASGENPQEILYRPQQ